MQRHTRKLNVLLALGLPLAGAHAQLGSGDARPRVRITTQIDRARIQTLAGTRPEALLKAAIGSRMAAGTRLNKMILVLQPTDTQKAGLRSLLDSQQDRNSANFHKWLTPDQYAAQFGVASSDVAAVSSWLADSGLSVDAVSHSGQFITFSGPVSSVESTFKTEMHHLTVNGRAHISNTTELSIPQALAGVVRGVKSLNDFHPQKSAVGFRTVQIQKNDDGSVTTVDPLYGSSATGTHYIGAADLASIFNATPLQKAGITGKGQTIAILARSNIQLSDVDTYRALFGLPKNTPTVIQVGSDPGQNADDIEAYLDAEMAGSLATDATVDFIVSSASLVASGIDTAGLYAVDNNIGDVISLSYGGCEAGDGQSGTNFWSQLWEQAAAQGQTPFVSSGDSGAAGCDSSGASYASGGYGVNALSSTGYAVSVGGSMFVDQNPASYWGASSTIPYSTALGYVPEAALNQSRLTTTLLNPASNAFVTGSGIFAGGGGVSLYSARPAWQKGSGIPTGADAIAPYSGTGLSSTQSPISGLHRLQPDLSFISANGHDGTLFCAESSCYENTGGGLSNAGIVGGTSVAAPAMASAQALINAANGGRQGNANIYYYALSDRQWQQSQTACQVVTSTSTTSNSTSLPASSCYFHDIVEGSNTVPSAATGTAGYGFLAQAGFDEATGLGSPNIANLARDWKSVTFNATNTSLSLTPTSGQHGFTQNVSVQVLPASGSGTPTGDVSLIATPQPTSGYGTPITLTLSGGSAVANINSLPAGTYSVYAHYAGDTTYAASSSLPVTVTIGKENSTTNFYPYSITTSGSLTNTTSFVYGAAEIYLDTEIYPVSGYGVASGAVTFTLTGNGGTLAPLTTQLDTLGTTYLLSGPPIARYYLLPNYSTLPAGSYTVQASYAGDSTFNSSNSSISFQVAKAVPTVSFTTSTAQVTANSPVTLNYTIATPASASAATGNVTFTDNLTGSTLGTVALSNGAAVLNLGSLTAGTHNITAQYTGDGNYQPVSGNSVTVVVSSSTLTSTAFTSSPATAYVGTTVTLVGAVSPVPNGGTMSFYDGNALLGTVPVSNSTGQATLAVTSFTAGARSITARYSGTIASSGSSTTFAASTTMGIISIQKSTTSARVGGANYAPYGQQVPLQGAFTRNPTTNTVPAVAPTGVISFYDGGVNGTLLGSATPVFGVGGYATYEATFNASGLALGAHSIVAVYAGDSNYSGSTSNTKPLTITQASVGVPSVVLTSGTASTTLSANISFAGSTTAPTGAVLFTVDNGTTVAASCAGNGTIRTCTASYPTGTLPVGIHTISATEAGDTQYSAATGTGQLTVTGGQASLAAVSSVTASGGGYTVTVTVTNSGNGPAQSVTVTGLTLGSVAGSPTPQVLGTIAVGSSASATFQVPVSAGTAGSVVLEKITGTYTGGTLGSTFRVRLPAQITF